MSENVTLRTTRRGGSAHGPEAEPAPWPLWPRSAGPAAAPGPSSGAVPRVGLVRHLIGAPFIYGLLVPLALLDGAVSLYQAASFRLWRISRVRRRAYVTFSRAELPYLDPMQRLNCGYCSYANGVLAYAREIAARTEQYWCPIQHPEPPADAHDRYAGFVPYGDPDVRGRMRQLRRRVQESGD